MLLLAPRSNHCISQWLAGELSAVSALLESELVSDLDCVNELIGHIEAYRGKMLRPMLVLVSGLAVSALHRPLGEGPSWRRNAAQQKVAGVVEMVHLATLVHDDVLDEAELRRGRPTLNALRGNEAAVMMGDFLLSHAYRLCSSLEQSWVAEAIAQTTNTVCEGELLQLANRDNWELGESTYLEIVQRKTASLCGVCCELAARLEGAPEQVVTALGSYGRDVGVAFQITDDLLDLLGNEDAVGKSLGRDLLKGKLTLPMIHGLACGAAEREAIMGLCNDQPPAAIRQLQQTLESCGSLAYARGIAERLIDRAKVALGALPASAAREALEDMADSVVTRRL